MIVGNELNKWTVISASSNIGNVVGPTYVVAEGFAMLCNGE